jgi:GT2 family glycosyltransferase
VLPEGPTTDAVTFRPDRVSIVVTTYGSDTLYTQACLEAIRRWKAGHHELIVVTHDETPLLRAYLEACAAEGLVDRLVLAAPGHGHTRGFNLGVRYATADAVFHVSNDIEVGPALVDDCAHKLRHDPQLGLIGWHWYNEGTFWRDGRIADYRLREEAAPDMTPADEANVRAAPWFTGRAFAALGGPKWLCLCNTSFFGARRALLDRVGGGFGPEYPHYWADDFLNYAVLDQGLDVRHFEEKFRAPDFFYEHQYRHTDAPDRRRHADPHPGDRPILPAVRLLGGGMTEPESVFLPTLARAVPDGATVTNVGLWRGSSAIVLLDALRGKRINFHFLDAFDLPGVSEMSAQPPVGRDEFLKYIAPFVGDRHTVRVVRANTLKLDRFPTSDFVFVDAGHTEECITHDARLARACLTPRGVAAFHDYGYPDWPAVKPTLDREFPGIESHGTVAVHRAAPAPREEYAWDVPRPPARPATPAGDPA